jgi:hypothetical protein
MLQSNEEFVIKAPKANVHPEYDLRGQSRYVFAWEPINITGRTIVNNGVQVLPAGQLIEIRDIPIPYHDSDSLQDERDNPDLALLAAGSPTRGAKFKPKTSFAIVQELIENYAVQGLVYLAPLSGVASPETSRRAAQFEARLRLPDLVNPNKHATLQDALESLGSLEAEKGDLRSVNALAEGLEQAIAHREAWSYKREAEIQLAQKGKEGRAATFPHERAYAASVGVVLTDANVMRRKGAAAGGGEDVATIGQSSSDLIATKVLMEQNEALAAERDEMAGRVAKLEAEKASSDAKLDAILKKLNIKA